MKKRIFLDQNIIFLLIIVSIFFPSRLSSYIISSSLSAKVIPRESSPISIAEIKIYSWSTVANVPWIKKNDRPHRQLGVMLTDEIILTEARYITVNSIVQIKRPTDAREIQAEVVVREKDLNLALLKIKNSDLSSTSFNASFGKNPKIGEEVKIVALTKNFELMTETLTLSKVKTRSDKKGNYFPSFHYQCLSAFPSRGIVICDNKICGLATKQQAVYKSLPPMILQKFFSQHIKNKPVKVVSQGIRLVEMNDLGRRKYYRLPNNLYGPLIVASYVGTSAYGKLKIHDILLSIAGKKLDNYGYYLDNEYGRLYAPLLFLSDNFATVHDIGEKIPAEIWRNGKREEIMIDLKSSNQTSERIPQEFSPRSKYIVENGIVFVELSQKILEEQYGSDWKINANLLAHIYRVKRFYDEPADDRVVIIANVFPDESNENLEDIKMMSVNNVDGRKIKNMRDFNERLKKSIAEKKDFISVDLFDGKRLYLDLKNREEINKRLRQRYGIEVDDPFMD